MCLAFSDKECRAMIKHMSASLYPLFAYLGHHTILEKKKEKWEAVVEAVNEVSKVKRSRRDVWQEFMRLKKEVHRKDILIRREERKMETAMSNGKEYDSSRMLRLNKVEKEFECLMDWAMTEGMGHLSTQSPAGTTTTTTTTSTAATASSAAFTPPEHTIDTTAEVCTVETNADFVKKEEICDYENDYLDSYANVPLDLHTPTQSLQDTGGGGEADVKEEVEDTHTDCNTPVEGTHTTDNTPIEYTNANSIIPLKDANSYTNTTLENTHATDNTPLRDTYSHTNTPLTDTSSHTNTPLMYANTNTITPVEDAGNHTSNTPLGNTHTIDNTALTDTHNHSNTAMTDTHSHTNTALEYTHNHSNTAMTDTNSHSNSPMIDTHSHSNTPLTDTNSYSNTAMTDTDTHSNTPKTDTDTHSNTALTDTHSHSNTPAGGLNVEGLGMEIKEELDVVREIMNEMCQSLHNINKLTRVISVTLKRLTATRKCVKR
ncbi:hypothetical protein E2C01_027676 [Portunus trituberculatus]|uniref:Uncharacterized protein n=1 Tax=Portunus trituberculatus TaxID=210409 RepID=A0A5B7EIG8_PORTR|nr:hypothetical protein [Portunus trituberculatus]